MHQVITINSIGKLVLRLKSHYIEAQAKAQAGAREGAGEVAKIGPREKQVLDQEHGQRPPVQNQKQKHEQKQERNVLVI